MFNKFHAWYDTVREPWRFFVFFGPLMCCLVPIYIGVLASLPALTFIGTVGMILMIALALSRVNYLDKK